MKIIDKNTNATVATIVANHSMTLDEAIALVGGIIDNDRAAAWEPEVQIADNWYFYEDLYMEY